MGIFGRSKGNKQLKKKVKREYKALKKSGDVKKAKGLGLSKKEMKEGIRKRIAEKAVIRKRNVTAKKASDNIAKKESSVATSKDMATERSNRSAKRQASMQSKADAANKDIKSRKAQGATNERVRSNIKSEATAKPGGEYDITNRSGYKTIKTKAMYGAKVKAVKKAKSGAALKSVPSKAKGLSKLPKGVRNKMGYMQEGGKVKSKSVGVLKSDTNKDGPKMEPGKKPYTKNGINYTWDRKNSVWRGDADKGLNVKKAKKGASVGSPYEAAMAKWEKAMDAWRVTKKEAISKGQLIPGPPTKPVKPPKASAPDISSKSDNTKTPNVRVNKKILSSFTANMKKWEKDMAAWKKADRNGEFDGKLIPAKPTKPVK
tara:strand:+ start:962 stop:2080 length:1119 start_codon:yes stop_codon:yes gene_type:complete